jgi:lipopolysaccharide cholinephosphotransferase
MQCTNVEYFSESVLYDTNIKPESILEIYQMLYNIDYVLNKNDIKYWMEGGTLLGAVRHGGMIPWDDDADIEIDINDIPRFLALRPTFDKFDYEIVETWFGYKIFPRNGLKIDGYEWKYPFVDIFTVFTENGKHVYYHEKARKAFPPAYNKTDNTKNLVRYKFGEIGLWGPSNPESYLSECYGNDWNVIAYRQYDHQNEKQIEKRKVTLTKEDRVPAKPTGPIKRLN